MAISEALSRRLGKSPVICAPDQRPLSFHELDEVIDSTIRFLNWQGIGRSDAVAVVLPNGPELAAAFLAISAGAIFAPLNPAYSAREFEFYLRDLGVRALVTQPGFCEAASQTASVLGIPVIAFNNIDGGPAGAFVLEGGGSGRDAERPGRSEADEIALLLHSSGTTARPKLVPLSHRNLISSAMHIAQSLQLTPADTCMNVMPLFHIHGLIGALLSSMLAGCPVYCTPGFNAHGFFRTLQDSGATWYTAVPTMHQMILARAGSRAKQVALRFVRSSSAHLHTKIWKQLEERFECPALNAYGMTEASHQVTSNPLPPGVRKLGTVGISTATQYVILDEHGCTQLPGATGEVAIRGTAVMGGYRVPSEANRMAFCDGWFRTGDTGTIDGEGYVTLTGRLKEIINCGGEKLSPAEIDEVVMNHPSVASALSFGAPCPALGERACAAVVLHEGREATEADLKSFVSDRLAKFKVPRQILILKEIPKGATGKMHRIGMAQRLGLG